MLELASSSWRLPGTSQTVLSAPSVSQDLGHPPMLEGIPREVYLCPCSLLVLEEDRRLHEREGLGAVNAAPLWAALPAGRLQQPPDPKLLCRPQLGAGYP